MVGGMIDSMIDRKVAIDMRKDGKTLQEIANVFGVSRERVRQVTGKTTQYRKQILNKRDEEFKLKAKQLRKEGKTIKEIGESLEYKGISRIVGSLGILNPTPKGMKKCYGYCKEVKKPEMFYKNSRICISCTKKKIAEYNKKNKDRINKYQKEIYQTKGKARMAVRVAIKKGLITRGVCEQRDSYCSSEKTEAHHYLGYDKENYLNVQWFCPYHHKLTDRLSFGRKVDK